jgi:hypothetical protein
MVDVEAAMVEEGSEETMSDLDDITVASHDSTFSHERVELTRANEIYNYSCIPFHCTPL